VVGLDIVGDVVYATNRTGAIRAYDLNKGNLIEWMNAGPEVFAVSGFFDATDTAVQAYEVSKSEHLILRQSNETVRILAHRWNPFACNNGHLPPAPSILAEPRDGEVELLWGGTTGITGTVKSYNIFRSEAKEGPYRKVGQSDGSSYRDKRSDGQSAWYRVSTINLVGEGPQSEPVFASAAAATAKRITGMGAINADGLDLTTRGNWQGIYGSEAAYLQDHVATGEKEEPHRHFTAGSVVWPGIARHEGRPLGQPVGPSDDLDRLQSVVAPGKRCGDGNAWGPVTFQFNIADGKPRQVTIAYARDATFVFRDPNTGMVILEEKVAWPKDDPKIGYAAFRVSGHVKLELSGERFSAVFIDPAPAK